MSCVNRNTEEFKNAVVRLDVHPDNLELIVHEFINREGNENKFPSDSEILSALRPKTWIADESSYNAWSAFNFNNTPEVHGNLASAMESYQKWKSMFPESAVSMWRDSQGHYVTQIATPTMEGVPYAFDNTLIDNILNDLEGRPHQNILKSIINLIGRDNIKIEARDVKNSETTMKDKQAKYGDRPLAIWDGGQVTFNPFKVKEYLDESFPGKGRRNEATRKREIQRILTHELTHALSLNLLRTEDSKLSPKELKFKNDINYLYKEAVLESNEWKEHYGFENVEEFIAEALSNSVFQSHLAKMKSRKGKTLWQRLINAFKELLESSRVKIPSDSILTNVLAATSDYMKYYEKQRAQIERERDLQREIMEEEYQNDDIQEDLFVPSVVPAPVLRDRVRSKLNRLKDGLYSFKERSYKGNKYLVFNIPVARNTMEEAVEKGIQMLEKEGFDAKDFHFNTDSLRGNRDERLQTMTVRILPLYERHQRAIEQSRMALEEKQERDAFEDMQYEVLQDQERLLNSYTQQELDFLSQLEDTNPSVYQSVINGTMTIDEAMELERDGELGDAEEDMSSDYTPEMQSIKEQAIADGTFMKAPNGNPTNLNERQWLQVRTQNFINWFGDWLAKPQYKDVTREIEETISNTFSWVDGSKVLKGNNKYYYTNNDGIKTEISKEQYDDFNDGKSVVLKSRTVTSKELIPVEHSYVLDENGEPLVMYHRTPDNFSIFDLNKSEHGGFWFSKNPNYYGNKVKDFNSIGVFLNIRKPNVINHDTFLNAIDGDATIEGGLKEYDGWITEDVHTPEFYGDTYDSSIVFAMTTNPNQIKSATGNTGEFSTINDDINAEEEVTEQRQKVRFDLEKDPVHLRSKDTWQELRGGEIIADLPQVKRDKVANNMQSYMKGKSGDLHHEVIDTIFSSRENGTSITSTQALDKVIATTKDKELRKLAKLVKDKLGDKEIPVIYRAGLHSRGFHPSGGGRVLIGLKAAKGESVEGATEGIMRTIVHELAHELTVDAIMSSDELKEEIAKIMGQLSDYMKQNGINQYLYAMKNQKEFIAEFMSQPLFREALKQMPDRLNGKPSNKFLRVLDTILRALGLRKGTTLFDSTKKAMEKVLNTQVEDIAEELREDSAEEDMTKVEWARTAADSYEVSSQGDRRFSALNAKFKPGTTIEGVDVGGMTIENVYQNVIKKSGKGKAPATNSKLHSDNFGKTFKGFSPKVTKVTYTNESDFPIAYYTDSDGTNKRIIFDGPNRGWHIDVESEFSDGIQRYKVATEIEDGEEVPVSREEAFKVAKELYPKELLDYIYKEQKFFSDSQDENELFFRKFGVHYINESNLLMGVKSDPSFENFSYYEGYLPLWQEWARQNPKLMQELREKSRGKTLTDKFANTKVSQARALADILNSEKSTTKTESTPTNLMNYGNFNLHSGGARGADSYWGEAAERWGLSYDTNQHHYVDEVGMAAKPTMRPPRANRPISEADHHEGVVKATAAARDMYGFQYTFKDPNIIRDWAQVKYSDAVFAVSSFIEKGEKLYPNRPNDSRVALIKQVKGGTGYAVQMAINEGKPVYVFDQTVGKWYTYEPGTSAKVTPTLIDGKHITFQMAYPYSRGGGKAPGVKADTTFDAIKTGERTATTRYTKHGNIDTWSKFKVGDVVEFKSATGEKLLVRITNPLTKLSKDTNPNEWSKKEGWSVEHFNQEVKPEIDKGEAYQIEFEYINQEDSNGKWVETDTPVLTENFAGIGTRELNDAGKAAIDEVFRNTVNNLKDRVERPTEETNERLYEYGGEFEGATNYLVGIVPDNLLRKVEDYIMSGEQTELSEADALEFLRYADSLYETEGPAENTINQEDNNQESIKKENKSFMERTTLITQQIDNLNNSTALSATEVRHIAEQAVYWISDAITEYMENPESLFTNFPEKRTMEGEGEEKIWTDENKAKDIDKVKAIESRADLVRFIGPDALIALCKAKFSPENADYEDFDTIEKAEVITNNWDAIMMLASDVFLSVEDFSIVSSRDGKTREVNTDITADADNFNESNMQNDVEETEGSLQEHWQIETKTLDVLATMSQMVRQALQKCYLLDKDGNYIKSEFGINERVNAREATNSILRWAQGALDLADMIKKLEEKRESNPWVTQLIDRLSDTSGKEADFQGQFFGTFYKHFQSYSVVIEEDGKFKSIQVNENPALSEAMTQVTTQYKIGEHPLFTNEGINRTSFSELKTSFEELGKYKGKDFTEEEKMEAATTLGYISNLLGYYVTPEMIADNLNKDTFKRMYSALSYMVPTLERNLDNETYEPFKFKGKEGISGNTREFLKPITEHLEDTAVSAFYDSGKMYQSYITPSYTSKLFQKFKQSGAEFDKFMQDEYGQFEWFKDPKTIGKIERGWRNQWLKLLATDSKAKEIFKHKVQLNFNKHNYMRNMSDMEYALSLFTEYFSENTSEKQSRVPAWFRVPMLSNKPSSEFIRFYSERGSNYKDVLTSGFKMIFDQELSRIQTVEMRNKSKKDKRFIKNFDKNGRKFMFLDFMNDYLKGGSKERTSLGRLIRAKLDGAHLSSSSEMALLKQAKEAIMEAIETRAEAIVSQWESQGIVKAAEKVANIGTSEAEVRDNLKNFVWNDTFAAMNIMQLTITDTAFYKDAEDLQKRLAQIHAPGIRGRVDATDYEGKAVTDGKFRTIKLTDFDSFISNIIDNVSVVFDRKIERARTEDEKRALRALKDSLVGKDGAYRKINVADAQGYSSPSSYRKKALIFGKWSSQAEDIYQKLKKGTYTYNDLKTAFQPLKPFVYSQIEKESGSANAPMSKLKVPVQFKNSEYLLIMADALTRNENTGKPNILRAIYDVMENSHYDSNGNYRIDGIDTVQFESTVKSGLMGRISLNDLLNDPHGEAVAKARMETAVYKEDGTYNNITVDTVPFEDYCLQQEVPEHFKEHEQAHGSQLRYIIPSELEDTNYLGEKVTYNLEGKQVSAKEFKDAYEQTIADNIQDSIDELAEELSLNSIENIKDRNIALSKILQREILSSPRYGIDLLQACSVDENGRFRIPLGDPIQSKRVEQLINSIIKNRINKQKIAGGPVVQVTNFGTTKELNIRFKDKNGDLLMTRDEYEKKPVKREISQVDRFNSRYKKKGGNTNTSDTMSYEDYIKENQAGIAYFEVFAPIYSNKLFEQFADQNGVINIQAIEMLDPDLLKMIGYRIPTEDKYSMAPLKIVGFLPREAGDGIMLPNDITLLTGSDFDVDKEYLMRKDYNIKKNDIKRSKMHGILYDELIASQKGKLSYDVKIQLNELINQFLDNPFDSSSLTNQKTSKGYISMPKGAYNRMLRTYLKNRYTVEKPTSGRAYRNNKIVDMTYEVLTHETSVDKMLNPGGFDQQKKMGYLVEAYKLVGQDSGKYSWDNMKNMSIDELKDLTSSNKNLSYIDTHIQFYKQNSAAGALIGIFAVNRIAHAVIESSSVDGSALYRFNIDRICKLSRPFTVAGMEFAGKMPFDMRYDRSGQLIGKVMGSLVAASVDAVKDPILNLMNINSNTANILNTLVRMGMPFDDAALFLSQAVIADVLAEHSRENITGFKSLSSIIQERIDKYKRDNNLSESSDIHSEELTREELVKGLKDDADGKIGYKTLRALKNFQSIAEAMRMPTFATRFNSMSSAVGPLIIDNLISEHKMLKLSEQSNMWKDVEIEDGMWAEEQVDMDDIFMSHPILAQFRRTIGIADTLLGNMPANSHGFRNILGILYDSPLEDVIYGDRKLLSSLSDFYQSYLVMKGGVVDPSQLGRTITEFPKEFMRNEYKKKYPDNALIQAIKYGTDRSGRATLQVDITGLDTQQKEKLSSAWIDLHKVNPELSTKLFNYNFFRGGIGFSPKTFMALVPVYVKERIQGYVDTFRVLPSTVPEIVLDQFIRNNWDNNRLVPRRKVAMKQLENGNWEISNEEDYLKLITTPYFKMNIGGEDRMFYQVLQGEQTLEYIEVSPLGSNKEYLEISENHIEKSLNVPKTAETDQLSERSELNEVDNLQFEGESATETKADDAVVEDLLYKALVIDGVRTEQQVPQYIATYKAKSDADKTLYEKHMKKFFRNRFDTLGIKYNEELIDKVYKKLC